MNFMSSEKPKSFLKNFLEWFKLKPNLDKKNHKPPKFSQGQVWYCYAGENIGVEISGKGREYLRPYLIFKKLDNYNFIGLPFSTKQKVGSRFFKLFFRKKEQIVHLHQPRHFDYRRLKYRLGEIPTEDFLKLKDAFSKEIIPKIKTKNNPLEKRGRGYSRI